MFAEGERLPNRPPAILFHCIQCSNEEGPLSFSEMTALGATAEQVRRLFNGWSCFVWDNGIASEDAIADSGVA